MRKEFIALGLTATLAACGTATGDRLASGALIGGGAGAVFGGVGVVPGAIVGAAAAAVTPPEKVNLGDPVWNE